jgi:hypothetical protein
VARSRSVNAAAILSYCVTSRRTIVTLTMPRLDLQDLSFGNLSRHTLWPIMDGGLTLGKGIYGGAHTQIFVGDEGTVWPMELERAAGRYDRWGKDGFIPATEGERKSSSGYRIKSYELKLLAGFAQCYSRQMPLSRLPMIPAEFAELIIKSGGLTSWINSDEKRLQRFWKMVHDQSIAAAPVNGASIAFLLATYSCLHSTTVFADAAPAPSALQSAASLKTTSRRCRTRTNCRRKRSRRSRASSITSPCRQSGSDQSNER